MESIRLIVRLTKILRVFCKVFWEGRGLRSEHFRELQGIIDLRVHWCGPKPMADGQLLLANHVSYLDIIAIGAMLPLSFVAKGEVSRWPVLGRLSRKSDVVFVERDAMRSRVKALFEARAKVRSGSSMCIFPEGTTRSSLAPDLKDWKAGNIAIGLSAPRGTLCLGLHYRDHEAMAWIDDQGLLPHLFRTLRRPGLELFVHAECIDPGPAALRGASQESCRTVQGLAKGAKYHAAKGYDRCETRLLDPSSTPIYREICHLQA